MKAKEGPAPQQEVRPDSQSTSQALRERIVYQNTDSRKRLARRSPLNFLLAGAVVAGLAASYLLVHLAVYILGLDASSVPGLWVLTLCVLAIGETIWMVRS